MSETLPKLTKPEMARLVEIGKRERKHWPSTFGAAPATTKALEAKGLVRRQGGSVAKSGRIIHHSDALLTDAGRAVLGDLPEVRP